MTPSTPPRPRPRSTVVISTLAVLLALWLGLAAPAVSPVAPPAGAPAVTTADVDEGFELPDLDLPFADDDRGGRGRR